MQHNNSNRSLHVHGDTKLETDEKIVSKISTEFKKKLLAVIEQKFKDHESNSILAISTILDPRFKKLHFQSALAAASAITKINTLIKSSISGEPTTSDDEARLPVTKSKDVWA